MIIGVNHAQVNVPVNEHARARQFYIEFLGMKEIPRPPIFKSDGTWLRAGDFELHIGLEDVIGPVCRACQHSAFG